MPTWVRGYERTWLRGDVLAGITVTAYLIPQVMAYAEVAGVPPEAALWAAVGGADGVRRSSARRAQLSVGPESTTALMTATALGSLVAAGDDRVPLAAALALMVGLCCLVGWVAAAGCPGRPVVAARAGRVPRRHRVHDGRLAAGQAAGDPGERVVVRRRGPPGVRQPRRGARADGDPRPRHARRAADAQPLLPARAGRADRHAGRDGGRVVLRPPGQGRRRGRHHLGRPSRPRPPRRRGRRPDRADRAGRRGRLRGLHRQHPHGARVRGPQGRDGRRSARAARTRRREPRRRTRAGASPSAAAAAGRRSATPSGSAPSSAGSSPSCARCWRC